jgi:asparagine synthase (glutamine-hydrolysing)
LRLAKPGVSSDKIAEMLKQDSINFKSFYPLSRQVLMDQQIQKLLKNTKLASNRVEQIVSDIRLSGKDQLHSRTSVAEISTYMQNVLLGDADQMSMAVALEVRVPFMDYTLVEYVLGLPDKYKNPTSPKKLLVDAMGDLLPPEIVNRPKMGFTFPWKEWMKNELKTFCEERIVSLSKRTIFNELEVLKLWKDFLSGSNVITWSRIWYLVVLENWLQENNIED